MPLDGLPADLRSALLEFYFERNEDVPLADSLAEFLQFVTRWSPSLRGVATVVPMPDGWVGLSSNGERYASTAPCPQDFGRPGDAELSAREPILMPDGRAGWLALWGADATHVVLWKRMEEQLLARYAYAQICVGSAVT